MKNPDILIVIALDEEADEFRKLIDLRPLSPSEPKLPLYESNIFRKYRLTTCVSIIGRMGPAQAGVHILGVVQEVDPALIISVGLAGAISKHVKVGDLVIADQLDLYDEASAVEEDQLMMAGRIFPVPDVADLVRRYERENEESFTRWGQRVRINYEREIDSGAGEGIEKNIDYGRLHVGHLATGSSVLKSNRRKRELINRDRKILAVDMEAAAIALALEGAGQSYQKRLLVVKGISDGANPDKEKLDAVGRTPGALRRYALANAYHFLEEFVPNIDLRNLGSWVKKQKVPLKLNFSNLDNDAMPSHECLRSYEDFFKIVINKSHKFDSFDSFLDLIIESKTDAKQVLSIGGYPGVGKSTFIRCLFVAQCLRVESSPNQAIPIYLDLHLYHGKLSIMGSDLIPKVKEKLQSIFNLIDYSKREKYLIFIDGCDEYERDDVQHQIDDLMGEIVYEIAENVLVVNVGGVGYREKDYVKDKSAVPFRWVHRNTPMLSISRMDVDDFNNQNGCELFCKLHPESLDTIPASTLKSLLKVYGIRCIDLYILGFLNRAYQLNAISEGGGLNDLYYDYCLRRISELLRSDARYADTVREFNKICEHTFKCYISGEADSSLMQQINSELLSFRHEHVSIKEFLIGNYIVSQILEGALLKGDPLSYVYPFGINRFVKFVCTRSSKIEQSVFREIEKGIKFSSNSGRAHLCYILGRFEDRKVKLQSIKFLRSLLREWKDEGRTSKTVDDQDFRSWLLVLRTIYISLIYLEDGTAANEYMEKLLTDINWDNLNRGFHLEYYEDFKQDPAVDRLTEFDDYSVPPTNTANILIGKLRKDFETENFRNMTSIELQTLASLVVHRHLHGFLNQQLRESVLNLLLGAKSIRYFSNNKIFPPYIDLSIDVLSRRSVSAGVFIQEMYRLKEVKRSGWNFEGKIANHFVKRNCINPESVADHVYGCLLLADMFLPEKLDSEPTYQKSEVLKMLLIHDLAEAYEGDIPSFKKSDDDNVIEDNTMLKLSYLGSIEDFPGCRRWRDLWKNFSRSSTINGRIANDIDKLENIIQLIIYHTGITANIDDAELWMDSLTRTLSTEVVIEIMENIRHRNSGSFSWVADTKSD